MTKSIFAATQESTEEDDVRPTLTIAERDGSRLLEREPSAQEEPATVKPQPGDSEEPNNYIPLDDANPFLCVASLVLGTKNQQNVEVLPRKISLTALASTDHLIYDLHISFTNHLANTASALLSLPRLPHLLLLEENHSCNGLVYEPRVEEKARADAAFKEAAASTTQTATLSEMGADAHHVRIDKVPSGAEATFGVKFIQSGGLFLRREVERSLAMGGDGANGAEKQNKATRRSIADLAVLPGYTDLNCPDGGVPFDFELRLLGNQLRLELPEECVLREDLKSVNQKKTRTNHPFFWGSRRMTGPDVLSIVQLSPSLVKPGARKGNIVVSSTIFKWKTRTGLARGTLLKARIVQTTEDDLVDEIEKLTLTTPAGDAPAFLPGAATAAPKAGKSIIKRIDTIEGVIFDVASGAKCDSVLLDLTLPYALPDVLARPSPHRHEVYVIVDTSGSTSMRTGAPGATGESRTFLDTSKALLDGILQALPGQIMALRQRRAVNDLPITVRLWSFNSDTTVETEATIWNDSSGDSFLPVAPLRTKVRSLKSMGCTNYDSWAAKLRQAVSANPTNLHSVLLSTDGGATNASDFFAAISDIGSVVCNGGFFQVDSLGYGPWLNAKCVSYLAEQTGGEALMVETLDGKGVENKVLSILTRSLVRAASQLALTVENGKLLAVALSGHDARGQAPTAEGATGSTLKVNPGQSLRLVLLHPSGTKPGLRLVAGGYGEGMGGVIIPWLSQVGRDDFAEWEVISGGDGEDKSAPTVPKEASSSSDVLLRKMSRPNTLHALRHLAILEPAYSSPGSVHYPPVTANDRTNVTLRTSLLGQIIAPSVTKGVAVVALETQLEVVPEHCRPKPSNLKHKYAQVRLTFEDEQRREEEEMFEWKRERDPFFGIAPCSAVAMAGLPSVSRASAPPRQQQTAFASMAEQQRRQFEEERRQLEEEQRRKLAEEQRRRLGQDVRVEKAKMMCLAARRQEEEEQRKRLAKQEARQQAEQQRQRQRQQQQAAQQRQWQQQQWQQQSQAQQQQNFFSGCQGVRQGGGGDTGIGGGESGLECATTFFSAVAKSAPVQAAAAAQRRATSRTPTPLKGPGYKVTEQEPPGTPSLANWIKWTRGGVHPSELGRLSNKSSNIVLRLTKTSIKSILDSVFARANTPKSAFTFSDDAKVSNESLLLRTIECAVALDPSIAGLSGEFEKWISLHESDLTALASALVFVAMSFGVSLDTSRSTLNLGQYSHWPWLVPNVEESHQTSGEKEVLARWHTNFVGRQAALPCGKELASRKAQEPLFTPAVRRDIYRILLNPCNPELGSDRSQTELATAPFGTALIGRAASSGTTTPDTFAFVARATAKEGSLPLGYSVLDDAILIDSISHIGSMTPNAFAVTLAFEDFLSNQVLGWTEVQASVLSVEFLTAFGVEMTPRLDVHHRIRSQKLAADEIEKLSSAPFCHFVNQETLRMFQI